MKKMIIIITVLILVGIGITGIVMYPNFKYIKVNSLVSDGKFDEAIATCKGLITPSNESEIKDKIQKVNILKNSKDEFSFAIISFNSKDYARAYTSFKLIPKEDKKNYAMALSKISECVKLENEQVIAQAQISVSKQDYNVALENLEKAINMDKGNKELLELQKKCIEKKNEIIVKDEELASEELTEYLYNSNGMLSPNQTEAKIKGVKVGMTQQECLNSSWGEPEKVNKTTTAYGTKEQWVYDGNYLYFEDGILTTIQN